jgi:hypothetical protein
MLQENLMIQKQKNMPDLSDTARVIFQRLSGYLSGASPGTSPNQPRVSSP